MSETEFDVIVWGASGFTGKLVAEYLHNSYGDSVRWAMAGRNQGKLEQIRDELGAGVPVLVAESQDEDSLRALVSRTTVICTTVGPYAMYGSKMVEVCADLGVHYCDLTGEVQWMRRMIDLHDSRAQETGARIVHTCGFDSIPSDMGVYYLQSVMQEKHGCFADTVKYRVAETRGGFSGGTVESIMNMMEEAKVDRSIFELLGDPYSLNPVNMPRGDDTNDQMGAKYDSDFGQWTSPFVMAGVNTRVVRRSHALSGYPYGSGFRYDEAMLMGDGPGGFTKASMVAGGTGVVMLGTAFSPTRNLLRRLAPSPGEGPSREMIESGYFNIELHGSHPQEDAKDIRVCVTGDRDPGYGATSKMLAESALCLALDALESKGGVTTPSVAMGDCLLKRLQENAGMSFSSS